MHLFKSFIQDLDTSFIHSELILHGDFNVNFTGSNLNIDKAIHLIPKWRRIDYSFACMLISPLCLVYKY